MKSKKIKALTMIGLVCLIFVFIITPGCVSNVTISYYVDDKLYDQQEFDGTNLKVPDDPVKLGYKFDKWYFDKDVWDEPVTVNAIMDLPLSSDVKVYARFVPEDTEDFNKYNVTLDSMGGTYVSNPKVLKTGKIEEPEKPTNGSKKFMGWYTSSNYDKQWDFNNDVVDHDMTLYAKWESIYTAPYYDEGYSVTPINKIESVTTDGEGNVYITYAVAKVTGVPLNVTSNLIYNTGDGHISTTYSSSDTSGITDCFEQTIADSTGHKDSHTDEKSASVSVSGKVLFWDLGVTGTISTGKTTEDSSEHTESTSESVSNTKEHSDGISKTTDFSLANYPENCWYRLAIVGDCIVTKTFKYNLKDHTLEPYYDSCLINDTLSNKEILQSSSTDDYFKLKTYNYDAELNPSDLYKGSGTESDPYQITNVYDLILAPIANEKYFVLTSNIDKSDYNWFDPSSIKHLEYGKFSITPTTTSEIVEEIKPTTDSVTTDSVTLINNEEEFMNIYKNPSGNYKLAANIDLTGYTIPEYINFTGVLDGDRHTITGSSNSDDITIKPVKFENPQYYGLFSENSGTIKNLTLYNFSIQGDTYHGGEWVYAGCIAGKNNSNGTISNVNLMNCSINCNRLYSSIGMVTGLNEGTIDNCKVNRGLVMGNGDGGGITGQNTNLIDNCSVIGNGVGDSNEFDKYKFLYFYRVNNDGGISRSWGGITGYATSTSTIKNSNVNNLFVYCYFSTNKPNNYNAHIGYLVGHNEGTIDKSCSVGSVSQKRNGDYSAETKKYYLDNDGSNGYVGLNTGNIPW